MFLPKRKIILIDCSAVLIIVLIILAYGAFRISYLDRRFQESTAAWDTGTLVVEYLKTHDIQWPTS